MGRNVRERVGNASSCAVLLLGCVLGLPGRRGMALRHPSLGSTSSVGIRVRHSIFRRRGGRDAGSHAAAAADVSCGWAVGAALAVTAAAPNVRAI
eukprot:scaffold161219_cov17-Tisochrysis_lutea.AAC.1